ncbi:MAG: aldehyde dehydrogenase family protein [Lachnospiraceae bacterium]
MEYNISNYRIENHPFVNGQYIDPDSHNFIKKISSVTGESLPDLYACNSQDVDHAVKIAKKSYDDGVWSRIEPKERKEVMLKLADLMEEHALELATLDTYETGRAFRNYVYDSIPKAIEAIRYFAEAVDKLYDKAITPREESFCVVVREPLGVVGIITPWNDPLVVASWKFAPALLMGNSVVIKPAEQSSLSLLRVAALAKEAGVPDGVFNVITGYGEEAGKTLALHQDVNGIFFTGSSEVGKLLFQYAGQSNMKKVALECGGKGPYIVTKNFSDVKLAAETLAQNMFYNQGQICSAPSKVIVHSSIKDQFIEYLQSAANDYVPGNPYNIENNVGCVVSQKQYDRVLTYIEQGKKETTSYYVAESRKDIQENACGIYPAIFWDLPKDSKLLSDEIFGPVVCIQTYDTIDEAIAMANDTRYGLAGAVWTENINEAYYVAKQVKTGLFHVNSYGEDDNCSPFGGFKESGNGKDKSIFAFDEYSELKSVWLKMRRERLF